MNKFLTAAVHRPPLRRIGAMRQPPEVPTKRTHARDSLGLEDLLQIANKKTAKLQAAAT